MYRTATVAAIWRTAPDRLSHTCNNGNGAVIRAVSFCGTVRSDQSFLAQALHQPFAATVFFGNSVHGP
jgi:hypothetical protein